MLVRLSFDYSAFDKFLVGQPLGSLAVFPLTVLFFALNGDVHAFAMLSAEPPLALVPPSVRPFEFAKPVLFVVLILSIVLASIFPYKRAVAMHFVVFPLTLVPAAVIPRVNSPAVEIIIQESPDILRLVRPFKQPLTVFHAAIKMTLVDSSISP